jgi:hypothetical protein
MSKKTMSEQFEGEVGPLPDVLSRAIQQKTGSSKPPIKRAERTFSCRLGPARRGGFSFGLLA